MQTFFDKEENYLKLSNVKKNQRYNEIRWAIFRGTSCLSKSVFPWSKLSLSNIYKPPSCPTFGLLARAKLVPGTVVFGYLLI